jgi:hypothetical protein
MRTLRGIGSGIGNTLAEFPSVVRPLSLEPRLALAREELGDDVRLVVIDAASMGLQPGLAGYDNEGSGRVYCAGLCVNRQAYDDNFLHRCRHCTPVRLSCSDRCCQSGRAYAPTMPHEVQTMRGPKARHVVGFLIVV